MTIAFKNAKLAMTTGGGTAYTCPAATTAVVIYSNIANVDGTNSAAATVSWTDDSDSDAASKLLNTVDVPADSSLKGFANGLVLEAGDTITAVASADSDLVFTLGMMERS
jgi:hypothetical protein